MVLVPRCSYGRSAACIRRRRPPRRGVWNLARNPSPLPEFGVARVGSGEPGCAPSRGISFELRTVAVPKFATRLGIWVLLFFFFFFSLPHPTEFRVGKWSELVLVVIGAKP